MPWARAVGTYTEFAGCRQAALISNIAGMQQKVAVPVIMRGLRCAEEFVWMPASTEALRVGSHVDPGEVHEDVVVAKLRRRVTTRSAWY